MHGVDVAQARGFGLRRKVPRDRGADGGVVHEHRALRHARERAVRAGADRAQVVVVADAGQHDLRPFRGRRRRGCRGAAVQGDPLRGALRRAVVDGDLVPLF